MKPERRNIELKARCSDLNRARRAAKSVGARRERILHQIDTYFTVANGRLKLREIRGEHAELIWYERDNKTATRDSRYTIVPVPDPKQLKAALSGSLGVRSIVKKRRELWMFHNVRIHLDTVESLGTYIEFEAVINSPAGVSASRTRLATLTKAMRIGEADRISTSYGDLINPAGVA